MSEPSFPGEHDYSLLGESHVRAYRESDGEVGFLWNGVPTLLLTSTGRRTSKARTSALIFVRDCNDYLLVGTTGGALTRPALYLNLRAILEAEIQVKSQHIGVVAHTASEDDKPRLWKIRTDQLPNYDVYQ